MHLELQTTLIPNFRNLILKYFHFIILHSSYSSKLFLLIFFANRIHGVQIMWAEYNLIEQQLILLWDCWLDLHLHWGLNIFLTQISIQPHLSQHLVDLHWVFSDSHWTFRTRAFGSFWFNYSYVQCVWWISCVQGEIGLFLYFLRVITVEGDWVTDIFEG